MKIRDKLALTVVILAVLPISFTFLVTLPATQAAQTQEILSHLLSVATIHESRVEEIIGHFHQEIDHLNQHRIPSYIDAYLDNSSIDLQALAYEDIIELRSINSHIDCIEVVNTSGIILASTNATRVDYDLSGEEYFIRALTAHVVDAFYLDANSYLKLHLAGPIIINETVGAVVIVDYNPSDVIALFQDYTGLGNTGEALLAKRDEYGDALFITPLRHRTQASLNLTLSKDDLSAPITQALLGVEDTFREASDYLDHPVLAVTRYISELDWGIVVKIDIAEGYGFMYASANTIVFTSILSAFVILAVGFVIARSITEPISKLIKASVKISEGDLSKRANVTSGDEMEVLANSVNIMADTLVNSNVELEERVEQRTRELEIYTSLLRHDLRNDIGVIFGNIDIARLVIGEGGDEELLETINSTEAICNRMTNLIKAISRSTDSVETMVGKQLKSVVAQTKKVNPNLTVNIHAQEATENLTVPASRLLVMVWENLIRNAAVHGGESSIVDIEISRENNAVHVVVSDNGPGVPEEIRENLFQKGISTKGGGLGLYLSREIIQSIGGSIELVTGESFQGAKFKIVLPLILK